MTRMKVLIVDDERTYSKRLTQFLIAEGYDVASTEDGVSGLAKIRQWHPNIVLLDIMLPKLDGIALLRVLRRDRNIYNTLVVLVSAKGMELDKITGLDAGADAYLTKPVSTGELLSTIRAVLRRAHHKSSFLETKLVSGNLVLDTLSHTAVMGEKNLNLTVKMFAVLELFMRNKGKVLSRDFILEVVWEGDGLPESNTVNVHIRWIRGYIEEDPDNPVRIVTLRGAGFRFDG